jgi:hypothetical protein
VPRGPSRPWKQLAAHTEKAMPYIKAALAEGYDIELTITEIDDDEVVELRRGLFNAAKHQGVSVHANKIHNDDGTWTIVYAVHDKVKARARVLAKYGNDRQKWPYNPRRPSPRDEDGNRTDI